MNDLFPRLAQRVTNTPLMIHPGKADVIMAAVGHRFGIIEIRDARGRPLASEDWAGMGFEDEGSNPRRGYEIVEGVAVIAIRDTLVQRTGTLTPYSGMTGYDGIRQNLFAALADPAVRAIALDVDSPGGEVAGCFDLVDAIYRAREVKPIWAILGENAYSAAYALASAAQVITVPRTGGTGSVGVIYIHVSQERALREAGIKVTLVTKGDLKGEGNEFSDLSDDAFARLKADVMAVGDLFDATVARNRGLKPQAVFDTQAGTFLGDAGLKIGFADEIMAPDEAFSALLDEL